MRQELDAFVRDLLCSHPGDPANARYLVPLEDPEQEEMAQIMADEMYSAAAEYRFSDKITKEQADRVWEQYLIDARRMLYDEDYLRIFEEWRASISLSVRFLLGMGPGMTFDGHHSKNAATRKGRPRCETPSRCAQPYTKRRARGRDPSHTQARRLA